MTYSQVQMSTDYSNRRPTCTACLNTTDHRRSPHISAEMAKLLRIRVKVRSRVRVIWHSWFRFGLKLGLTLRIVSAIQLADLWCLGRP